MRKGTLTSHKSYSSFEKQSERASQLPSSVFTNRINFLFYSLPSVKRVIKHLLVGQSWWGLMWICCISYASTYIRKIKWIPWAGLFFIFSRNMRFTIAAQTGIQILLYQVVIDIKVTYLLLLFLSFLHVSQLVTETNKTFSGCQIQQFCFCH